MSHLVTIRTDIKDLSVLKEALERKGYSYCEREAYIHDYYQRRTPVDLAVFVSGEPRIGFRQQVENPASIGEETYQMVGDFYGLPKKASEFLQELKVEYARLKTIKELEARNFRVVSEVKEKGNIVLTARRWAA
jgi:hypothetical protein